jgi:cell division protease FtsH
MNNKQQFTFWYLLVSVAAFLVIQAYLLAPRPEVISYSQFKALVRQNLVTNLVVGHETISGDLKAEAVKQALSEERLKQIKHDGESTLPFMTVRVEDPELTQELEAAGIPYRGELASNWLPTILSWVVPIVLFFLVWSFLINRMGGAGTSGLMQIGKSKAKVFIERKTGVTFADVEGIDEAKDELVEVVEFLRNPGKYQRLGGHIPKGVLLLGPPGTGKTL